MSNAIIGNKKFVVIEQKKFDEIQLLAVQKPSLRNLLSQQVKSTLIN